MAGLIAACAPGYLVSRGDPFQTLARSIVGQQISVKAAQSAGGGTVPAYLKKQISNYQDALSKLTGSG